MAMVNAIEVLAESPESWEDAAHRAVNAAAVTVRNIQSIWIANMEATVEKAWHLRPAAGRSKT
jgi:dodecin